MNAPVEYIQKVTGYSEIAVSSVIEAFCKFIQLSLRQGNEVRIEKFGNYFVKDMPERLGRNPRTGEEITIPQKRKPVFKFSKTFIQSVQSDESLPPTAPASSESAVPAVTAAPAISTPTPSALATDRKLPPPLPPELKPTLSRVWFVSSNDGSAVEIAEGELIQKGVNSNTPLWSEKTGWKLAKDVAELGYLFEVAA